jgi:ATP-dependent helicase Lhr and Lhr-like helicase
MRRSSEFGGCHPRLADWFRTTFTDAQFRCVPSILKRESILLTSPTGSGKTLAAFLGVFDYLLRELDVGSHSLGVRCLYVSPLRALTYDIGKNLRAPIAGMGLEKELLIHVRTGDTNASERTRFRRKPSHFLVTTPENLAVLLAQESYAMHLASRRFVIVDELHSLAGSKRGVDLALSLERLEQLISVPNEKSRPLPARMRQPSTGWSRPIKSRSQTRSQSSSFFARRWRSGRFRLGASY